MDRPEGTIGSSEITTVLGLNSYETPLELWYKKIHGDNFEGNLATRAGTALEPLIMEEFGNITGIKVIPNSESFIHPEWDWVSATPDAFLESEDKEGRGVLEVKTSAAYKAWDDGCATYAALQCMWQMGVTGAKWGYVAAVIGGRYNDLKIYPIEFDNTVFEPAVRKAQEFLSMVKEGIPPTATENDDMTKIIKFEDIEKDYSQDENFYSLCEKYELLKSRYASREKLAREVKKELDAIKQQLLQEMDGARKVRCDNFYVELREQHRKPSHGSTYNVFRFKRIDDGKNSENSSYAKVGNG